MTTQREAARRPRSSAKPRPLEDRRGARTPSVPRAVRTKDTGDMKAPTQVALCLETMPGVAGQGGWPHLAHRCPLAQFGRSHGRLSRSSGSSRRHWHSWGEGGEAAQPCGHPAHHTALTRDRRKGKGQTLHHSKYWMRARGLASRTFVGCR